MTAVLKSFETMKNHAESIRNDEHQHAGEMSPGDAWAQGDIAIVLLESVPSGCDRVESPSSQLAPGETQGSRHCIEDMTSVVMYRLSDATPLQGPVIDATKEGVRINHPQHGDVTMRPGVYGITYQRAFAEELRRIQD